METLFQAIDISGVIQLAVAPVFLLAGISGTLMVMSSRLGRIIDRGRYLKELRLSTNSENKNQCLEELECLKVRARYTNWAIFLCTSCTLLVSLVIVMLFLSALFNFNVEILIASLFVVAMLCLIISFILFLREVRLSTSAFRFTAD
ncbi:MAG: DUF2721 domain-containing protein [Gammaproteobacteria bacterium]|nr:DUF2721 domain-containing protein [Gammaproteobacteria bacterium]